MSSFTEIMQALEVLGPVGLLLVGGYFGAKLVKQIYDWAIDKWGVASAQESKKPLSHSEKFPIDELLNKFTERLKEYTTINDVRNVVTLAKNEWNVELNEKLKLFEHQFNEGNRRMDKMETSIEKLADKLDKKFETLMEKINK